MATADFLEYLNPLDRPGTGRRAPPLPWSDGKSGTDPPKPGDPPPAAGKCEKMPLRGRLDRAPAEAHLWYRESRLLLQRL